MGGNCLIKFTEFLAEGGNARAGNISAQAIDTSKIDRKSFVKELIQQLIILNKTFEKEYGFKIWDKESYLNSGKVFSGSTEHFINLNIPDDEFRKLKPTVGDIDVQVSDQIEKQLHDFFKKHKKTNSFNN